MTNITIKTNTSTSITPYSLLLSFFLSLTLLAIVQFSTPNIAGYDGYYHIKIAEQMRDNGVPLAFENLPLTIIDKERYLDMHMLFHVFQIPFTYLDNLVTAAKLSAVVFAAFAFLIIAVYLATNGYIYLFTVPLFLLASSSGFLYRIEMPRAQIFGLLFMVVAAHVVQHRKAFALGFLTMVFVWTYKGFPILFPVFGVGIIMHMAINRSIEVKMIVAGIVGLAAGLVINPYFPNNVNFLWDDLVLKIFSHSYKTVVGTEWYKYDTGELIESCGFALVLYIMGIFWTNREQWRQDYARLLWFVLSTLWLIMLFKSKRFVEYFPPSAVIFFLLCLRSEAKRIGTIKTKILRFRYGFAINFALGGIAAASLITLTILNMIAVSKEIDSELSPGAWKGGALWLARNTEPGSMVFHTDWDDFPMLYHYNASNHYIVGLDPDYLYSENPELFDLWSEISIGEIENPSHMINHRFKASFVISDRYHDDFLEQAYRDPLMVERFKDAHSTVFEIVPPKAQVPVGRSTGSLKLPF